MMAPVSQSLLFIGGFALSLGFTHPDPNRCISTSEKSLPATEKEYCIVTQADVKLSCSPNEIVVLLSLLLATKIKSGCMKRILSSKDEFCCNRDTTDVLYDGHCLQDLWNKEDMRHYQTFITQALVKCTNKSHCVLKSEMFANLQTEIPVSKTHSSYFQILYRCIPGPTTLVDACSSRSMKGKEIHLHSAQVANDNKTCTCRVTSQSRGDVIVKAVDVRSSHNGLILSSSSKTTDTSQGHLPMFGFRKIFTDKKVNLSVKLEPRDNGGKPWIHLSGSDEKDISVICGETTPQDQSTPKILPDPIPVFDHDIQTEFMGYWPLIYVASGSIFTLVLVVCILGVILICKYRKKKGRCRAPCRHPPLPHPADFHHDPRWHHYATVTGANAAEICLSQPPGQATNQCYDKPYTIAYECSTSARNPNNHMAHGATGCDVSQLEAFLNCNEDQ